MLDIETLCAYLDNELPDNERAVVQALLADSADASETLARLRQGRSALSLLADERPSEFEAARMDRHVLSTLRIGNASNASTTESVKPKRTKIQLPYFAAAAVIAVALIAGLGVLARTHTSSSGTAQVGSDLPRENPAKTTAESSEEALSGVSAETTADLDRLLAEASGESADASSSDLGSSGAASGEGKDRNKGRDACLSVASGLVTPQRINAGTWQGQDAYFVIGPLPDGQPAVVVLLRPNCIVASVHS